MEPSDVFKSRPVFRYSEVLTPADIDAIKHGYIWQWQRTPWYLPKQKFKYLIAIGTLNALFDWLKEGKPIKEKKDYE
jgi:hypothetical protein